MSGIQSIRFADGIKRLFSLKGGETPINPVATVELESDLRPESDLLKGRTWFHASAVIAAVAAERAQLHVQVGSDTIATIFLRVGGTATEAPNVYVAANQNTVALPLVVIDVGARDSRRAVAGITGSTVSGISILTGTDAALPAGLPLAASRLFFLGGTSVPAIDSGPYIVAAGHQLVLVGENVNVAYYCTVYGWCREMEPAELRP
jgi:hypothetical protein